MLWSLRLGKSVGAMGLIFCFKRRFETTSCGSVCGSSAPGGIFEDRNYANATCIANNIGTNPRNKITQSDLDSGYIAAFNNKYWDPKNYKSDGKCLEVKCDPENSIAFGTL